jgi:hypothetical protein
MNQEPVIISDLHGTFWELNELLRTIQYNPRQIRLISVGDLVDRGPAAVGCLRKLRELKAEVCKANHEAKWLRYRKHALQKKLTGKDNPVYLRPDDLVAFQQLKDDDFQWMESLPTSIHVEDDLYVIHAGLEPAYRFKEQSENTLLRCRYVDKKTGTMVPLPKDKTQPKGSVFWANVWNGKQSIVFGHNVFESPQVFRNERNTCVGIDCGAVFGGYLTAFFPRKMEFVKIKAQRVYYERKNKD